NDAFPLDASEASDTDGDGIGNNADLDVDGDGILDVNDAFPLDASEASDTDGDGIGNNADSDDDGDGTLNVDDAFPLDSSEASDTDGDGIGNNADSDDDGDGTLDVDDALPLDSSEVSDTDDDGIGNNADSDDDGDGILDVNDAFPLDASEASDTDGDGIGNNADSDDDGDGILDVNDALPLDGSEVSDTDGDGIGNNADPDDDGDGILDVNDAFPLDASEVSDTDGDGIGNNSDSDDDGDGILDVNDAFPLDSERQSPHTNLVRGPYLQMASDISISVRWRTTTSTNSVVKYGLSPSDLNQSVILDDIIHRHEVILHGLTANTRYYYSIGSTDHDMSGYVATTFFETSPASGDPLPVSIWVIGDAGTADQYQTAVYNGFKNTMGTDYTDLFIMLGDNAYPNGRDEEYQVAVFDMYSPLLRTTPVWPTLGNHDGKSADSITETGFYYEIFSLPRMGEVGGIASGTEAYYSFDHGNIHFIVLDSFGTDKSAGSAMLTWMESDLQQTNADWVIAYWHHPPYTKGTHDSDTEEDLELIREATVPILEAYGVDLVLAGHSHSYERSKLIAGHYGHSDSFSDNEHSVNASGGRENEEGAYLKSTLNQEMDGAVYIVAGSSGKIRGGALDHEAMFISLNLLGSMIIDVEGLILNARFIDEKGIVQDYFTIDKSNQ
ncbi:MAG: metallophosphoesterase, partial [Bermanella sp.]